MNYVPLQGRNLRSFGDFLLLRPLLLLLSAVLLGPKMLRPPMLLLIDVLVEPVIMLEEMGFAAAGVGAVLKTPKRKGLLTLLKVDDKGALAIVGMGVGMGLVAVTVVVVVVSPSDNDARVVTGVVELDGKVVKHVMAAPFRAPLVRGNLLPTGEARKASKSVFVTTGGVKGTALTSIAPTGEGTGKEIFLTAETSPGMRSILTTGLVLAFRNVLEEELALFPAATLFPSKELGTCFKLPLVGGLFAESNVFASSEFRAAAVVFSLES